MCVREIDKYLPTSFCGINDTEIWNKVPIILMHFVQGFVKYVHLRSLSPCLCPVIHWVSLRLSIYPSAVLSMEHSYSWPSKTSLMRAIFGPHVLHIVPHWFLWNVTAADIAGFWKNFEWRFILSNPVKFKKNLDPVIEDSCFKCV